MGLVSHLCLWVFGFWQGWVSIAVSAGICFPVVFICHDSLLCESYIFPREVMYVFTHHVNFLGLLLLFCFVFLLLFFFFPDRFKSSTVKECIHAILKEKLANVQYVPEEMPQLTKSLSEIIKDRLKGKETCWGSRFFSYCVLSL